MNEKDKLRKGSKRAMRTCQRGSKSMKNGSKLNKPFSKPSSRRGKGGKIMFPTDNEARKVAVQSRDVDERVRHNKRNEELTERGQNMDTLSKVSTGAMSSIAKALGNHPA